MFCRHPTIYLPAAAFLCLWPPLRGQKSATLHYVRLTEVLDLQTLTLIKLTLDREGLPYRVLFEHSLYVGAYLLGNRGAVVEVAPEQFDAAAELLEELGVPAERGPAGETFGLLHEIDAVTEALPLLGRWGLAYRLLLLALVGSALLAVGLYYLESVLG